MKSKSIESIRDRGFLKGENPPKKSESPATPTLVKRKVGRPSKYKIEFVEQVYKLCLLGAIDEEIAEFFGVNTDAFYEWQKIHPEFAESVRNGKIIADAEVGKKLHERAIGYDHQEEVIFCYKGEIVVAKTIKHYPPEPVAIFYWLNNRRKNWHNVQRHELTGENGEPIKVKHDYTQVSDEEARKVVEAAERLVASEANKQKVEPA